MIILQAQVTSHVETGKEQGDGFWMGSKLNLPSGKLLHNYGKSPCYWWENPLFLWPFTIAMLVYQRVPWGNGHPGEAGFLFIVTWPGQEMSRWRSCRTCRFRWILPPPFACKNNFISILWFHIVLSCSFMFYLIPQLIEGFLFLWSSHRDWLLWQRVFVALRVFTY